MPYAVELSPTTNYPMASAGERSDQMVALARVLMGLGHPTKLVSQAREVDSLGWDWKSPPRVERKWFAVAPEYSMAELELLRESLEGVGLRAGEPFVAPDASPFMRIYPSDVQLEDGYFASTLVLRRWPREVKPGWLGHALGADEIADTAIAIRPQDPQHFARFLRKQASWQQEANASKPDAHNDLGARDAESVRKSLIAGTDRPAKVAIAVTVRARSREELPDRVKAVAYRLGLALADVRKATLEQDRGVEATSLTPHMRIEGAWRTLDCMSVASTGIFQPTTVNHEHGAPLGTTNGMLVKLDPFDMSLRSFGMLVTGSVGSGKSFLLKLLLLGQPDVERWVVEQSDPSEYAAIPGVRWHALSGATEAEQAANLRDFIGRMWDTARSDPRPRLLVLDELWSLIAKPELAVLVEEIARRGRKFYLSLCIATQQAEELIRDAKAVFDNAAIRCYLQQEDRDLTGLGQAARLSAPARQYLRGAARGQVLLYVNGMYVPVNVQAQPEQYRLINTDPRERLAA